MTPTHLVSKVLVVDPEDKVLTLRRSATDTRRPLEADIPGGWVEEGEDVLTAAIRETEEETGIKLTRQDVKLVYSFTAMRDGKNVCWLFFVGHTQETEVRLSNEHDKAQWLDLNQAVKTITYKVQQDFLIYVRDNNLHLPA